MALAADRTSAPALRGVPIGRPLAAWIAPIFLLRFVHTTPHARVALLSVFVACAVSILVGRRGGEGTLFDLIVGLIALPLLRGIHYTLPYGADRLIGSRLSAWPRQRERHFAGAHPDARRYYDLWPDRRCVRPSVRFRIGPTCRPGVCPSTAPSGDCAAKRPLTNGAA